MTRSASRFAGNDGLSRSGRRAQPRPRSTVRRGLCPQLLELENRRLLADLTVMNTNASGTGSLLAAITTADGNNQANSISFSLPASSTPPTITLGGAELELSDQAGTQTITGPPGGVIISGGGSSRVFQVDIYVTASLSGLTITGGEAGYDGNGGGVSDWGTVDLTDCTISGNSAGYGGGGLSLAGTALLNNCIISDNNAATGAGLLSDGAVTLSDCTLSGNAASGQGGGMFSGGNSTLAIKNSAISGNSALTGGGFGMSPDAGTATFNDCTISNNTASHSGGGGELANQYVADKITDCTISGNTAVGAFGGGLVSYNGSTLNMIASTVSDNSAATYGGGLTSFGTTTLTDTIVAGNTSSSGASDIVLENAGAMLSSTYNLIGPGGSGGLNNGTNHNIVLSSTAGLGLAALGSYGGPLQTMALLPGSPALGAGTATSGVSTDERGDNLHTPNPDIGAYQSQGFTVTPASGTPQSAQVGTSFAAALIVEVKAKDPAEPVAGGVVSFNAPSSGPSAALSSETAMIGSGGAAQVSATANSSVGTYAVLASIAGSDPMADFQLTNTTTVTPTLSLTASTGSAVYGQPVTFTATVTAAGGAVPAGMITFFAGGTLLGTASVNGSGVATFTAASLAVGTDSVTASYGGDSDLTASTAAQPATVSVGQASTRVVLVPVAVFGKKHKVMSLSLRAEVEPAAGGGAMPAGTVTFELMQKKKPKVLGTATLAGGTATLPVKSKTVLMKSITVLYGGDADFQASTTTAAITTGLLVPAARALVRLSPRALARLR